MVFAGLVLVGVAIALGLALREPPGGRSAGVANAPAGAPGPRRVDFPVNVGGSTSSPADAGRIAEAPPPVEKQVETLMGIWRGGIVARDPDAVVAADGAFVHEPQKFRPALMTSAQTDPDDRVRAFSTRVLGKLKDPACAAVFQKLLADRSEYVRMNAAWGLGELANTPEGRAVAKHALPALQRLAKTESAKDTRDAASLAARRLM
ncbi:MAG TPA: HEAT repeat domain-containing protein [Polyangia bacterium]|nr:HEAT repeat domain-containing protein [Polyangia bacterium]